MREIKFRAWVKNRSRTDGSYFMLPVALIDFGRPQHGEWRLECVSDDWGNDWYFDDENAALMQYTGLKDKNGKEIYEGDILEHYSGAVPKGSNPIIRQAVKWKQYRYININNYSISKVIGNIYENPELLEGVQ